MQNDRFPSKSSLLSKCYKISLYENRQHRDCKALTGLSKRAKAVGGECLLDGKFSS